jgi:hypothetical protein
MKKISNNDGQKVMKMKAICSLLGLLNGYNILCKVFTSYNGG